MKIKIGRKDFVEHKTLLNCLRAKGIISNYVVISKEEMPDKEFTIYKIKDLDK